MPLEMSAAEYEAQLLIAQQARCPNCQEEFGASTGVPNPQDADTEYCSAFCARQGARAQAPLRINTDRGSTYGGRFQI